MSRNRPIYQWIIGLLAAALLLAIAIAKTVAVPDASTWAVGSLVSVFLSLSLFRKVRRGSLRN